MTDKNKNNDNKKHLIPKQSKYKSAKELEDAINGYFDDCKKHRKPPTIAGLTLALGFTSRQTLLNYENEAKNKDLEREEKLAMMDLVKKAKLKIEAYLEENLIKGKQVAGTIFNLKNNFGYVDKSEQEHRGEIVINISGVDKF